MSTIFPPSVSRHDSLIRGLQVTYVIAAALYAVLAVVFLKFHWDNWQRMNSIMTSILDQARPDPFENIVLTLIYAMTVGFGLLLLVPPVLLALRRGYALCFAAAILLMIVFPLGTILGGLTLYALLQPEVQAQFDGQRA